MYTTKCTKFALCSQIFMISDKLNEYTFPSVLYFVVFVCGGSDGDEHL